jgi:hypothetical protein
MISLKSDYSPRETKLILEYEIKDGIIHFKNPENLNIIHFSTQSLVRVDFIIDQHKNLLLGYEHYFVSNQAKYVIGAGTLIIDAEGKLKIITNHSGHYKPTPKESQEMKTILEQKAIDVLDAKLILRK